MLYNKLNTDTFDQFNALLNKGVKFAPPKKKTITDLKP